MKVQIFLFSKSTIIIRDINYNGISRARKERGAIATAPAVALPHGAWPAYLVSTGCYQVR